jgi:hypothetical protein
MPRKQWYFSGLSGISGLGYVWVFNSIVEEMGSSGIPEDVDVGEERVYELKSIH